METIPKSFMDSSGSIELPKDIKIDPELQKDGLGDSISGEVVRKLFVQSTTVIDPLNFILDFSKAKDKDGGAIRISVFQKGALKSLIRPDGDVAVYLYAPNKLVKVGKGDKYQLERMLPLFKKYIFDNMIKVYRNYQDGEALDEVLDRDITRIRLDL